MQMNHPIPRHTAKCWFLACSFALTPLLVFADEKQLDEKAAIEKFNVFADTEAQSFQFSTADAPGKPFELTPQPLLVWTNPVSGSIRGRVYLWSQQGIPQILASIYKYDDQTHISSEVHSLVRRPMTGKNGKGETWDVRTPSVEFKSLPNAPRPAASRPVRLVQMRDAAKRFAASRTDPDKSVWQLRLLSQPLYRYAEETATPTDGALFAFVQGTNPDVILVLEANETNGQAEWKYALARMHRYVLNVELDGTPVHQFAALSNTDVVDKSKPYTVFRTQLANPGGK